MLASNVNQAISPVAAALETATQDGAVNIGVAVTAGVLTWTADELHTFHVDINSLTTTIPPQPGNWAPTSPAVVGLSINGHSGSPVTTSGTHGKVAIEIDIQNLYQHVQLYSGHVVHANGQTYVQWSNGHTSSFFGSSHDTWAVRGPDGQVFDTGFPLWDDPSMIPAAFFAGYEAPPQGLRYDVRSIYLTYDVLSHTFSGVTSDGIPVTGGVDGHTITVSGASKGYPDVSFTVSMS
jgi:hypothetical protein